RRTARPRRSGPPGTRPAGPPPARSGSGRTPETAPRPPRTGGRRWWRAGRARGCGTPGKRAAGSRPGRDRRHSPGPIVAGAGRGRRGRWHHERMAAGTPVWFDQLDAGERAALRPGVPASLDRRPDVLVVGGGAQGLAAAMACRARGLGRVLLIERDHLAAGPSGSAAGVLCPDSHLHVEGAVFVEFPPTRPAPYDALGGQARPAPPPRWAALAVGAP